MLPALLTVSANPFSMAALPPSGAPLPTLPAPSYCGFVNGDSVATLSASPNLLATEGFSPTANTNAPGVYSGGIGVFGAVDPNYNFAYVGATLIVGPPTWTGSTIATASAGGMATTGIAPGPNQAGVTAALNNGSGSAPLTVVTASYASDPEVGLMGDHAFAIGSSFLDLEVPGASSSVSLLANFFSLPNLATAPTLQYWTGSGWENVEGSTGPPVLTGPTAPANPNPGTWEYTVVFNSQSQPPITALNGTVFALGEAVGPTTPTFSGLTSSSSAIFDR